MFIVDIIIFLLVLGLLIFVHELGHFVAAKACGIYCKRFSLGMPPRLFGIKLGETDYCVGAVPFGGYVKMAGQEDAPLTEEERQKEYGHVPAGRWLSNKPIWQRFVVFAMGPLMNLVLAIVAATGAEVPEMQVDNRIGVVSPESAAAQAPMYRVEGGLVKVDTNFSPETVGWETGDRILSIDGNEVSNIVDAEMTAALSKGKRLRVEIERIEPDGRVCRYLSPVEPRVSSDEELARFGIEPFETAVVTGVAEDMPAYEHGIRLGDIITRANGRLVDRSTFVKMVEAVPEGETLELGIQRGAGAIAMTLRPQTVGRFLDVRFVPSIGFEDAGMDALPEVLAVAPEVTEETGLQRKDVIVDINGQPATLALLSEIERTHPGETVTLALRRPAVLFGLLQEATTETVELPIASVRAIGVELSSKTVFHRVPPILVIPEAFRRAYHDFALVMKTLAMLVTGGVSPKSLGGPVMIYQATTRAAQAGYWLFVRMTAFISVNLFVFNLLPLPILDGGQILLLSIEGVRRKPVNIKAVERFQQIGLVLIIGLMFYVTYNDVLRWVKSLVP